MNVDFDAVVDEYLAAHAKHATTGAASALSPTEVKSKLSEVINKLRALNVPWMQILSVIATILPMILAGQPIGAIIQAILALLVPKT